MDVMSIIAKYAKQYGVEKELITAVVWHESSFNEKAINPKDPSYGFMQVMVPTSNQFGPYKADDLLDGETNIKVGTQYLKYLQGIFTDVRDVMAGYNAGPGGVKRPYSNDNMAYINSVFPKYTLLRILGDLNKLVPFLIPIGILAGFLLIPKDKQ